MGAALGAEVVIRAREEGGQGDLTILPWLLLTDPVIVDETAFVPVTGRTVRRRLPGATGDTVALILRRYRDARGHRLRGFTVALHRQGDEWTWKTPEGEGARERVNSDRQILALACLAEQKFFRNRAHLNGAMFVSPVQSMTPGKDGICIVRQRRDGQTLDGWGSFSDVTFQAPLMIPHDICAAPSGEFLAALVAARTAGAPMFERVDAALPFFILGVSELPDLISHPSAMLLALAFSRLIDPYDEGAHRLATNFGLVWSQYARTTLQEAGLQPDAGDLQKYAPEQLRNPVHMKWAKELYETRSSFVHHGTGKGGSRNWTPWQHVIAASFAFPLTVKLLLAEAGFYQLSDDDKCWCGALDRLLVEGFRVTDSRHGPNWPQILAEEGLAWERRSRREELLKLIDTATRQD